MEILSQLTEKIQEHVLRFETAREREKEAVKKAILELQKKRDDIISKLKSELK